MKNNLIAACLQLTSSSDIYKNLKETIDLSNKAIDKGAFLISTPEVTNIISLDRQKLKRSVFLEKDDPFLIEFTKHNHLKFSSCLRRIIDTIFLNPPPQQTHIQE